MGLRTASIGWTVAALVALAAVAWQAMGWLQRNVPPCVQDYAADLLRLGVFALALVPRVVVCGLAAVVAIAVVIFVLAILLEVFRRGELRPRRRRLLRLEAQCRSLAFGSYRNPGRGALRYSERFWFTGGVFGHVEDVPGGPLCVVFRGTSEAGNWFLTNAQAHMVRASEVLESDRAVPVPGGVHNGFVKAFEDLWWDGKEDELRSPLASYTWSRWAWPIMCALVVLPVVLWPALWPELPPMLQGLPYESTAVAVGTCIVAGLAVLQFVFADGHFERAFRRSDALAIGPALGTVVAEALRRDPFRHVVFTGHSLGGALAALAFAQFRGERKYDTARADLVTFGAPRPGDDAFLRWLVERCTETPGTGGVMFADLGDPVPYLPPALDLPRRATRRVTWLSALLVGVWCVGWLPYAVAYRVPFRTRWAKILNWSGREGLSPARHFAYLRLPKPRVASRG